MAFKFRCPTCNELFSAQDDMAEAEMTCPMCFAEFEVPRPSVAKKRARTAPTTPPARETPTTATPPDHEATARREPGSGDVDESNEKVGVVSPIAFRSRRPATTDELDMTAMVDVTFLLLIFFMVTAAFSLQKSFEMPASDDARPSTVATSVEQLEADPKYVIVRIDRFDTFYVGAAAWDVEQEAPSRADLLQKLRHARAAAAETPTHMLVMASEEASHGSVVTAMDAGAAVHMEDVKLLTVPAEE